jgi:molybdenum cofactor cytidylyltransferase
MWLSAIVLAAGLSQRMGKENKLLLRIAGVPLVRRAVSTLLAYPFVETVIVTGHEGAAVEEALDGLPVRLVRNPRYEEGQMTSVRTGLSALELDSDGVMVCLSDQPALTRDDLALLAGAFAAKAHPRVLVPTFGGVRGNPIVLARATLEDILRRGGNFGCKQFVAQNADIVETFEMPNDHVLVDIDRPEDYAAYF